MDTTFKQLGMAAEEEVMNAAPYIIHTFALLLIFSKTSRILTELCINIQSKIHCLLEECNALLVCQVTNCTIT